MSESNLVEEPVAKQNGQSHGKLSLLSAPGSILIKTTLMRSLVVVDPDRVLVKTSTDNSRRQRDAQTKFLKPIHV